MILGIFAGLFLYAKAPSTETAVDLGSAFETGTVTQILSDSCEEDPRAQNAYRGEQKLIV